ncbi:11-S seed storage protein [Macleaya cordata]|uniref:11-S seed storage protein n=1 Tax=Macleaya cordata TaxID=56857 RepID=A0A200PW27_MACCD|nr:11-S seed storage protein [Macleaya cordata]
MAITKKPLLLLIILAYFLIISVVVAQRETSPSQQTRLQEARQCRLQRLTATQPNQRIQSEGGVTELWNEFEDQFQCAGVAAMRNIIQPNSLSLPNFSPSPRLVYIEQGQGLLGLSHPGCAETYHSGQQYKSPREGSSPRGQQGQQSQRDQHQKVHRIRRGDIVALPAGVAHWCYNDGNEQLVAVSVSDLNNNANQLEQKLRSFYLAGGQPQKSMQIQQQQGQHRETFQNIFRAFDENLMAEAFNIPVDVVRRMQQEDERGLIVRVKGEGMRMIRPEEEEEYEQSYQSRRNGLDEVYCNMQIRQYLDNPKEADVYSRQAGRLNIVNSQKLRILNYMDMSAEKGNLYPNAMHTPHWTLNAHSIVYVTRGEAHVQVVGSNGQRVLDERVNQGNLFVVPQHFVSTIRAGDNGFEYVAFKTSGQPMKSPLVGYTSAFKAMPIQVLTNSFQISSQEAQSLKYNREHHTMLLPPRTGSSS